MSLTFELVTLDGIKFSEECHELILPTPEGQMAVFPDHMPLIAVVVPGVISVRRRANDPDSALEHFASAGGMVEVLGNSIRILADEAEAAEDINELEAKAALERAKELRSASRDRVGEADAVALIERYSGQLRVAELHRRHQRRRSS